MTHTREEIVDVLGSAIEETKGEHSVIVPTDFLKDVHRLLTVEWIDVNDRLPDTDDHALCCTQTKAGRRNVIIGYYLEGAWRCGMNSNVTHWMPLPEPPEEDET